MPSTGWQHSRGIDGSNPLDWVATFPWMTWQHSRGLGGRNPWNTHLCTWLAQHLNQVQKRE